MRIIKLSVLFWLMLSSLNFAAAQVVQGPFPWVKIGGLPMNCTTAQGQTAAIYIDQRVNQYIGTASNNGYPVIRLGPGFSTMFPPLWANSGFRTNVPITLLDQAKLHLTVLRLR